VKTPKITVIGSMNMDLVTKTLKVPNQGETLLGEEFITVPGGKGANQAVASARLGAEVTMIGCVGEDSFGKDAVNNLQNEGVFVENVKPVTGLSTGIATIILSEEDNRIIVVPGANSALTPEYIAENEKVISESDIIVLQLEIPIETVEKAIEIATRNNVPILLNPAPIQSLSNKVLNAVTYLTPNEHELEVILQNIDEENLNKLKKKLVVTKGSQGVSFFNQEEEILTSGYKVDVQDTTGAGDTFNGAFAVAISKGMTLEEACDFGNAAAALSVTKLGAQSGMPSIEEVTLFLEERKEL
jgi:ribokinase